MKQAIRWIPAVDWPLRLLIGIGLGVAFLYAGVQKYLAPDEFAEAILAYQLLPEALVGLSAAFLPWLELAVGGILVFGYLAETGQRLASGLGLGSGSGQTVGMLRRSALLLIMVQLLLFIVVLLITMARGLKIDCGCGLFSERQVGWAAVLEDFLLFGATAWVYWREGLTGQEKGVTMHRSAQM
ncbi:MAG: MauE/DoxX family redox-associated membrane protein [Desulfobaccales bacterium]